MEANRAARRGVTPLSQSPAPRAVVLVFARWWADGPVKTRLAAEIGAEAARAIYRRLAEACWSGLEHPALAREAWITPATRRAECAAWLGGARAVQAQPEGDLGARLAAAFDAAFAGGAPWAAAVGTDAPDVDAARVLRAGASLRSADVVLVPAEDGGYALIALRAPQPRLFEAMPWSTPQLLAATRARCGELGLRLAELEPVADVDDLAGFRRIEARLPPASPSTPPTRPT